MYMERVKRTHHELHLSIGPRTTLFTCIKREFKRTHHFFKGPRISKGPAAGQCQKRPNTCVSVKRDLIHSKAHGSVRVL